jgi:hypothetical protein
MVQITVFSFRISFFYSQSITNILGMDPDGNLKAFNFVFDDLVPCVAGGKAWTLHEKASKLILEAEKVVSLLDKAITISALMN